MTIDEYFTELDSKIEAIWKEQVKEKEVRMKSRKPFSIDTDYKWVREGFDFYRYSRESKNLVKMKNENLQESFLEMSKSFLFTANSLMVNLHIYNNNGDLDTWIFPVLYLYRHSLELLLKHKIIKLNLDEDYLKDTFKYARHSLKVCAKEIGLYDSNLNENINVTWVRDYIDSIEGIDTDSDFFRYPFSMEGALPFTEQTWLDLQKIFHSVNRAYGIIFTEVYDQDIKVEGYTVKCERNFLVQGSSTHIYSVVGYQFSRNDFFPYINGYGEASKYLLESDVFDIQDIVFPILYLYRNCIELSLKGLIYSRHDNLDKPPLKIFKKKKHSILGLWNTMRDEVKRHNEGSDDTDLISFDKYIQVLHDFDNKSDIFRYPCDKNLNMYFQTEFINDINNFRDLFQEMISFLDGVDSQISVHQEYEREMRSYYDY
ncbi:hypothetical protein CI105_08385 [Candidatus Izimaplasma bacterium ZiA1]|uniref:hypothetical protein n=1 Tax=Candidatus Izimoplasma sp. ZiA1 TaxID=2024899 RepID=UPI000BAA9141|nr:hypothetical protein CI105_08385 [Candidatus Izimaplasma bacterium ZiA1]